MQNTTSELRYVLAHAYIRFIMGQVIYCILHSCRKYLWRSPKMPLIYAKYKFWAKICSSICIHGIYNRLNYILYISKLLEIPMEVPWDAVACFGYWNGGDMALKWLWKVSWLFPEKQIPFLYLYMPNPHFSIQMKCIPVFLKHFGLLKHEFQALKVHIFRWKRYLKYL